MSHPIKILCPNHGIFVQHPQSHLSGSGCPKCHFEYSTFGKSKWIKRCIDHNKTPLVYIIRCYNAKENFIKIGITSNNVQNRYGDSFKLPYSYEILKEIKGSPDFVGNKEKELHRLCKAFKYKPLIAFDGSSECFTLNCLDLLTCNDSSF